MPDNKVKISNILNSLIPDFIGQENPLFKEFLEQYYISEERDYGATNLADNLAEYKKISYLSEIETVRAQTIPAPGTSVPPQVVVVAPYVTLPDESVVPYTVFAFDEVIYTNHTKGFPDSYGLLKIDNEIITYTGKTANSFTGCKRGFSGVSAIEQEGNPEFLTFSDTQAEEHAGGSVILNLNFVFLGQFYNKFKDQFLPGVEKRAFAPGLSVENILTRAKDFYTSKGTDTSLDILFKVLFGKKVTIVKPFDSTIAASDAEWMNAYEMIVQRISGDPKNTKFSTVYQGDTVEGSTARGAIANVEEIFLGNETYYKIYISKETLVDTFNISNKTKVLEDSTETVVTVDSTVGFDAAGCFYYRDSVGTYNKVEYTSKSYNQFYGCIGLTETLKEGDSIITDNFIFSYEDNDPTRICQMRVVGSISGIDDTYESTKFYKVGDEIGVKYLGQKTSETDSRFNSWRYNNVSYTDIHVNVGIDTVNKSITTKDRHYLKKTDRVNILHKQTRAPIDGNVNVTEVINDYKFSYNGSGTEGTTGSGQLAELPIQDAEYEVRKKLNFVSNGLDTDVDNVLTDIQNSFVDGEGNTYVAFSGYPSGITSTTNRSKTFTSAGLGSDRTGIAITNHNFLNGEKVYLQPGLAGVGTDISGIRLGSIDPLTGALNATSVIGIETGIYYVNVVDNNTIKLALSRQNIFMEDTLWDNANGLYPVWDGQTHDQNIITPYTLWEGGSLKNQNNFKRIVKKPQFARKHKKHKDPIGVTVTGIDLNTAISNDSIFYGQIDQINISNSGKDYDVINPPSVAIGDTSGSSADALIQLNDGYVSEIVLTTPGFDYAEIPAVTISGGNGTGAEARAKMKEYVHNVSFSDNSVFIDVADPNFGKFILGAEHKFLDGEEVIYTNDGTPVGVGSTNVGLSTNFLVNGGTYYVTNGSVGSGVSFSLASTRERALAGVSTINFTSDGSGTHRFTATRKRKVIDEIIVTSPGIDYSSNTVEVNAVPFPPTTRSGILTTFVGINTHDNYIYARNHNFADGEIIEYTRTGIVPTTSTTNITGLSTAIQYKVKVIDHDRFKLAKAGKKLGRTNLIVNSENLQPEGITPNVPYGWSRQSANTTITSNVSGITAPDGTNTSTRYNISALNGRRLEHSGMIVEAGKSYTFSWWMKRINANAGWNFQAFRSDAASLLPSFVHKYRKIEVDGIFYSENSNVGTGVSTGKWYVPTDNNWHKVSWTFIPSVTDTVHIGGYDNSGTTGNMWYFWGAQFEESTTSTDYIKTSGLVKTVDIQSQVLDYDNEIYVNLEDVGIGTHIFKYPDIKVDIEGVPYGSISIATKPSYYKASAYAMVKGKVDNVFIKSGGVGYGSSEIINHNREPNISLQTGEQAVVGITIDSNGSIVSAYVIEGGKDYSTPPIIEVVSSGIGTQQGKFAKLKPNIADGKIVSVDVLDPGNSYSPETTTVLIHPAGSLANFSSEVHKWTINDVIRYDHILSNPLYKDTVQLQSNLKSKGNKLTTFYVPKDLRDILGDNLDSSGDELAEEDLKHSPIIGWAYDGNPIYGPYGNTNGVADANGNFGNVKKLISSYNLNVNGDDNLRPTITKYPNGYFVDDYQYEPGSGDLDEYNGRYLVNDDFPNGSYAYFSSIEQSSSNPSFPYVTLQHYNETDEFNYDLFIEQSDKYINSGEYKRNVTHLGLDDRHRNYPALSDPLMSDVSLIIDSTTVGGITTVAVDDTGNFYSPGDVVTFSKPEYVSGSIKEVYGKNVVGIATAVIEANDLVFGVTGSKVTAYSETPIDYVNGDFVEISGISSASYIELEGVKTVGVSTVNTRVRAAIGNTGATGIATFISFIGSVDDNKFNVDDVVKIGNEKLLILNKDSLNDRYRVSRMHDNTSASASGIATGAVVTKLPRAFTFNISNNLNNKNVDSPKKVNFDFSTAVGIGSTQTSVIVGYAGTIPIYKTIPARAIYVPNHPFENGDQLKYVSVGSTIKYSINDTLSPQLDLAGISTMFCVKLSSEFIGISTQKIGVSTEVGFSSSRVYFTSQTEGSDHRLEKVTNNLTGNSKRTRANVTLDTIHGLSIGDDVTLVVDSNLIEDKQFLFDEFNRKITTKSIQFTADDANVVGLGTTSSIITIRDHELETGDILAYSHGNADKESGLRPLIKGDLVHVIKISKDTFKLASSSYDATKFPYENIVFWNTDNISVSLAKINPSINITKSSIMRFDVSSATMADYDINFYYDKEFEARFITDGIQKIGSGSSVTSIEIRTDDTFPEEFYYRVEGRNNNFVKTYPDSTNTDVPNYSKISLVDSKINTKHKVSAIGSTTFSVTLVGSAETSNYSGTGFSSAFYTTSSPTTKGGVYSIDIENTLELEDLPKVVSVASTGVNAVFSENAIDIGRIQGVEVKSQGLGFNKDNTLNPRADSYTILKLKNVYTLESVGIVTGGRNYTSPPIIVAIGNSDVKTRAYVDGSSISEVEVINNDSGLSESLELIPTYNSNGVGVKGASSTLAINTLELNAPVEGFATFPFAVGDKIYVENIQILDGPPGIGNTTASGYNSSDYDYRYFTVTAIDTNVGTEKISYSVAGIGSTGGAFDISKKVGRVIKADDLAVFKPTLKKVRFIEGEKIEEIGNTSDASGYVAKDGWDENSQILKLNNVLGTFTKNEKISSNYTNSKSIIQEAYDFNFSLTIDSTIDKSTDWDTDKGKLNFDSQRVHDNDYYQRFSYSIKGEVPYENWKEPIQSLGHISGYKPFGDLEILNGVGHTVGMTTTTGRLNLNVEIGSKAAVYERLYYDRVTEEADFDNISTLISFDSKIITDYNESRTNKVLLIDDISSQFTGKKETFTGQHQFIRSDANGINIVSGGSGSLTPIIGSGTTEYKGTSYNPSTGYLTVVVDTDKYTPTGAAYTASSGELRLELPVGHGLTTTDYIRMEPNSLNFKCEMDGKVSSKSYPRAGLDTTAYDNFLGITTYSATSVSVNVGTSLSATHNVTGGEFNPNTGVMSLTVASGHGFKVGHSIRFAKESLVFQCEKDNYASDHSYPRPGGHGGGSAVGTAIRAGILTDQPYGNVPSQITSINVTNVGGGYTVAPTVTIANPGIRTGIMTDIGFWAGGNGFIVGAEYPLWYRYPYTGGGPGSAGLGTEAKIRVTKVKQGSTYNSTPGAMGRLGKGDLGDDFEFVYGGWGYSMDNPWMRISYQVIEAAYIGAGFTDLSVPSGVLGYINGISTSQYGVGIGTTATATATIDGNGEVDSVTITNVGLGYTAPPAVSFSAPSNNPDPAYNKPVKITGIGATSITVGIGTDSISDKSNHRWKPGHTASGAIISGGNYPHEFVSAGTDSVVRGHGLSNGATISIADNSMLFRCDKDGYATDHLYPRASDPGSTSNSKFNSGVLTLENTVGNAFDVKINIPIVGGQVVGVSTFDLYTVDTENRVPVGVSTQRLFYKTVQPSVGVTTEGGVATGLSKIVIADNEFNTGEKLIYSPNGGNPMKIDNGSGGETNMPSVVYPIVSVSDGIRERDEFNVAISTTAAYAGIAASITSIGTGNTHTFSVDSDIATKRVMISIDNILQSPLAFKKDVTIGLATAVGVGTETIYLNDVSSIEGDSILKIQNELVKVNLVGVGITPGDATVSLGSTQALNVTRAIMGTVATAHTVGNGVTVVTGNYRIQDGTIHFNAPPYGPIGVGSLTTRSTFDGRSFYKLNYDKCYVYDDISESFDSQTSEILIKNNGTPLVGIETNYGVVLVNNIWQDPHFGQVGGLDISDYTITGAGSSIKFTGSTLNQDLPKGGIIDSFDITEGVGIQSAFRAVAIANVSAGGTIASISIGNSGSGYLNAPRVGIAITNYHFDHKFVHASPNSLTDNTSATWTPSHATYNSETGDLVLTIDNHSLTTSNNLRITNNTLTFQCSKDGYSTNHAYPRPTDPASTSNGELNSGVLPITNVSGDDVTVNVGRAAGIGASFTATIDNGMVTGVTVTNPGSGYTGTYQPIVVIDEPSPWKNLPLSGGTGSGAKLDVVIGVGGSAIGYELASSGRGYSVNDELTLQPVPYKVGVSTEPIKLTVKTRHQDKFSGWNFGQILELDDPSKGFNGYRKTFLIQRTITEPEYYSIVAHKDSGIVLANNLLIFINDVLQQPVVDYEFTGGTRIEFKEPPKPGSKCRMYLYVGSNVDYLEVDVDQTIKEGDTLRIQERRSFDANKLNILGQMVPQYDANGVLIREDFVGIATPGMGHTITGDFIHHQERKWDYDITPPETVNNWPEQDDRIIYELLSADTVQTQTYGGAGISTDGSFQRPVYWSKQQSDSIIDGRKISKSRTLNTPHVIPNTNIIASVASTDTKIYVKSTYPAFEAYDDYGASLNHITIVGLGTTALDTSNIEVIKGVDYTGDYGQITGIHTGRGPTGVGTPRLIFDLATQFSNVHDGVFKPKNTVRPGISTGDYFVIENTTIGSGVTALGGSGVSTSVVGTGTTWIDGIYKAQDWSTTGVGNSSIRVTCYVRSLSGIDTTGLPAPKSGSTGRICGSYTWGTVNVTRNVATAKSFTSFNQNGVLGIETSAYISRNIRLKETLSGDIP
tara:strand:+ start:2735 stop:16369 length:13635 start_codon:yes stop_codon:yes gene_type:complete